jgi:O-methyltransferase
VGLQLNPEDMLMISKYAKARVARAVNALGYKIERLLPPENAPHYLQLDSNYAEIIKAVEPFTMTPYEKIGAMIDAARYVAHAKIPGAIVECGVWRGGSMMVAALALREANDYRDLYLFDTYAGMTAPTDQDIDYRGIPAAARYVESMTAAGHNDWCYASLDDVRRNLASTGYPEDKCHFVQGSVLDTLPSENPSEIAILRLDTDWYESTLHELKHLYPKLSHGGVLIIDDYGYWRGCRKAVEEFFARGRPFLCRLDETGRLGIKAAPE